MLHTVGRQAKDLGLEKNYNYNNNNKKKSHLPLSQPGPATQLASLLRDESAPAEQPFHSMCQTEELPHT